MSDQISYEPTGRNSKTSLLFFYGTLLLVDIHWCVLTTRRVLQETLSELRVCTYEYEQVRLKYEHTSELKCSCARTNVNTRCFSMFQDVLTQKSKQQNSHRACDKVEEGSLPGGSMSNLEHTYDAIVGDCSTRPRVKKDGALITHHLSLPFCVSSDTNTWHLHIAAVCRVRPYVYNVATSL